MTESLWKLAYDDPKNRNHVRDAILARMNIATIDAVFDADAKGCHLPTKDELEGYYRQARAMADDMAGLLSDEPIMERVLDKMTYGLAQALDRTRTEMSQFQDQERDLIRAQDGTEIPDLELQTATAERLLRERNEAILEHMLEAFANAYEFATGRRWNVPARKTAISNHGATTAASYTSDHMLRQRKQTEEKARALPGVRVAISGGWRNGKQTMDDAKVMEKLDKLTAEFKELSLILSDEPGVATLAAKYAKERRIPHAIVRLDHSAGNRAAFKRNAAVLAADPKYVLAFEGNGPAAALVEEAQRRGAKVLRAS